jgi:hypothetical protein
MADETDRVGIAGTIELLFNDAAKTISDLKSRQWSATTLAVAGIIGLDSLSHTSATRRICGLRWDVLLVVFVVLVAVAHFLVMWRCNTNLDKFRRRLKRIVKERLDVKAHSLFDSDFEDAIVDEGTISFVALCSVWLALLVVVADILLK